MQFLKRVSAATLILVITIVMATASAATTGQLTTPSNICHKTFTLAMFKRAAVSTYSGTNLPSRGSYRKLWKYARCQRPPSTESRALKVWKQVHEQWWVRRHPPLSLGLASWYSDANGACASPSGCSYYGVANKYMTFGTPIEFCYHGRCINAVVDDRGPYSGAREWDLNEHTAGAIGFGGVDTVYWRIL